MPILLDTTLNIKQYNIFGYCSTLTPEYITR